MESKDIKYNEDIQFNETFYSLVEQGNRNLRVIGEPTNEMKLLASCRESDNVNLVRETPNGPQTIEIKDFVDVGVQDELFHIVTNAPVNLQSLFRRGELQNVSMPIYVLIAYCELIRRQLNSVPLDSNRSNLRYNIYMDANMDIYYA